jgi:DNA-binding response OmpR family regulator
MARLNILLVEDNLTWQTILKDKLHSALNCHDNHCFIEIVETFGEAYHCLKDKPWHLLVTDIGLGDSSISPQKLGTELVSLAHDRHIPSIAVSGTPVVTTLTVRDLLLQHGASDFFSKQEFNSKDFIAKVQELIRSGQGQEPGVSDLQEKEKERQVFKDGYALLVGVGNDLPVTVEDAKILQEILTSPSQAAYPAEQVQILTESKATRLEILAAFDQLINQVSQNPDATVMIYFSGHGGRIESAQHLPEYFLVPYDFDWIRRTETGLSGVEFTEKIEAIEARKLVVFLDCCHAGGIPVLKEGGETFTKAPLPPDLVNALGSGSGRVVVASSRENEASWTGDPYSVFTACLVEALTGKASVSQDGYARILDVLIYLFAQVPPKTSDRQHPFVNKMLELGDNFPLCYYAGGSKAIAGERPISEPRLLAPGLTQGQRRRLEQERDDLQTEWDLRREKVKRMKVDLAIEAGTAIKFQLEQQLLIEERELAQLGQKLDSLESVLQSANQ